MTAMPGRTKRVIPFIVAGLCGLLAVAGVRSYVTSKEQAFAKELQRLKAEYPEPVDVIVAAQDLEAGAAIDVSLIGIATVPEKFLQPYAVRSPQQAVGMVTVAPIAEGEQILSNKLRRPQEAASEGTLSGVLPKGKRAVTIGLDALTGVGGFIKPGDAVDILWSLQLPQSGQTPQQLITLALFQNVQVVGVGSQYLGSAGGGEEGADYTVTLALTPQETSVLLYAREQGRIQLALRSRLETGTIAMPPVNVNTINTLLEAQLGIKPTLPRATRQVEVYKGLARDVVVLPESAQP